MPPSLLDESEKGGAFPFESNGQMDQNLHVVLPQFWAERLYATAHGSLDNESSRYTDPMDQIQAEVTLFLPTCVT